MISDQLDMFLVPPSREAWGAYSPRALTRGHKCISFTAEGMGRLNEDASPVGDIDRDQLLLELVTPSN